MNGNCDLLTWSTMRKMGVEKSLEIIKYTMLRDFSENTY